MGKLTPIAPALNSLFMFVVVYFKRELTNADYHLFHPIWWVHFQPIANTTHAYMLFFFHNSIPRLPFKWRNFPIGYSIAFCFEYVNFFFILQSAASVLCFLTGSYIILTAIIKDVENELRILNVKFKDDKTQPKLREKFHEIIQVHSDAKQLSF